MISDLQSEGRLLNRTEETVHQEAELKKQWDDGLMIVARRIQREIPELGQGP